MAAMGALLATLTTRMEGLEKKQVTQDNPATSHVVYTALSWSTPLIVDDLEDDNVDVDSRYSNDIELNYSCWGSDNSADITVHPASGPTRCHPGSIGSLSHERSDAHCHQQLSAPVPTLGTSTVVSAAPLIQAQVQATQQ